MIAGIRTNQHFALKEKKLANDDLADFIKCYSPANRHQRSETERFKKFTYDEIIARDKTNLDIFWPKDESLTDLANLPEPEVIAAEIVENLEADLESFKIAQEALSQK